LTAQFDTSNLPR